MIATIKSNQAFSTRSHFDWHLLPNMLSGAGGMIIGWAIAFILGWF